MNRKIFVLKTPTHALSSSLRVTVYRVNISVYGPDKYWQNQKLDVVFSSHLFNSEISSHHKVIGRTEFVYKQFNWRGLKVVVCELIICQGKFSTYFRGNGNG